MGLMAIYYWPVNVDKMNVSFEAGLGAEIREAAKREGRSLSAWLAAAAADRLRADPGAPARRAEALKALFADWERENGAFTAEELQQARADLGLPPKLPVA